MQSHEFHRNPRKRTTARGEEGGQRRRKGKAATRDERKGGERRDLIDESNVQVHSLSSTICILVFSRMFSVQ